jgi:hypothetical protein
MTHVKTSMVAGLYGATGGGAARVRPGLPSGVNAAATALSLLELKLPLLAPLLPLLLPLVLPLPLPLPPLFSPIERNKKPAKGGRVGSPPGGDTAEVERSVAARAAACTSSTSGSGVGAIVFGGGSIRFGSGSVTAPPVFCFLGRGGGGEGRGWD